MKKTKNIKIIFIGAGKYGYYALRSLLNNGENITTVITLDEEAAMQKSTFVSYLPLAKDYNIPVIKVRNINDPEIIKKVKSINPDLIIEMSWTQLICAEILETPSLGTIGTHVSLLPKARGRAPINWAIINGEKKWGITLFYLHPRADYGDIIGQEKFIIEERDNCKTAYDKASLAAIKLISKYLPLIKQGKAPRIKQSTSKATYFLKRTPQDGLINWSGSAKKITRFIRAITHPYPGAFSYLNNKKVFIWEAEIIKKNKNKKQPGQIVQIINGAGFIVQTGDGLILITRLEAENGVEMWADNFIKEYKIKIGSQFINKLK